MYIYDAVALLMFTFLYRFQITLCQKITTLTLDHKTSQYSIKGAAPDGVRVT